MINKILDNFVREYNIASEPYNFVLKLDAEAISKFYQSIGLIDGLRKYSNLDSGPQVCGSFDLDFNLEQTNKHFLIFGTDHSSFDYGIEKNLGKVGILEIITGTFYFYIAKDEVAFIQALTKIIEFENLYKNKSSVTTSIIKKIRNECINLAGGEEYANLYKNIIISEDDMPIGPFTLP